MDLIGQMSQQLGIDLGQAQALAGGLLGGLETQVKDKLGGAEAAQIGAAIPELGGWKEQAAKMLGGSGSGDLAGALGGMLGGGGGAGGLGGLASAAAGMMGGGGGAGGLDVGFIAGLLGKLNLNPSIAGTVAPLIAQFLKDRLPAGLLEKLPAVAPFLSDGGGLGGMLGGLLGGR